MPTLEEFGLSIPLYAKFPLSRQNQGDCYRLAGIACKADFFCVLCGKNSVFDSPRLEIGGWDLTDKTFMREFFCSRDESHVIQFVFRVEGRVLSKIGQYPSAADLSLAELQKYRAVLGKELYAELARAVGMAAHGVGIGSFVYLRRIFEKLIGEARAVAETQEGWNGEAFRRLRMDEKIEALAHLLPPFLVEHRRIYGILSKGVHELSEQVCLEAFPAIRAAIELMLDEKVNERERDSKKAAAAKSVALLEQKLAAKSTGAPGAGNDG